MALQDRLAGSLWIRLFRNDIPVLPDSTLGEFDAATFAGSDDFELTPNWPAVALDVSGRAFSRQDVIWTRSAPGVVENIFGWVVYEYPFPGSIIVCGRNFVPHQVVNGVGDFVRVQVTMYALRG